MENVIKKYTNGEITIVWKPGVCIHSTICWKGEHGLKQVFNPMEKPWIKPLAAETSRIIAQVNKCPSGALSFYYNGKEAAEVDEVNSHTKIEIMENGPLLVYGKIQIKHRSGETEIRHKVTAFCRCGQSNNKPFCDGTHVKDGFNG